jgi:hypothetical protein
MNSKNIFTLLCTLILTAGAFADEPSAEQTKWRWLQSGLNFRPAVASVFEPRVGFIFYGNENNIRLDIGSAIDLLSRNYRTGAIGLGAEFFTYTLLESWDNMYFPVIASDYFFGLSISYSQTVDAAITSGRFRFTHISAHFVDGHFDADEGTWRDGRDPIIYSREFFEILLSYQKNGIIINRWYCGLQYNINLTPDVIGRVEFQGGYEIFLRTKYDSVTPYAAVDLRLVDKAGWGLNTSIQTGVKLGHRFGRGFDLFFSYYNGYNVHGELFDEKIDYWGFGFNVHL